jgi:hypothetical protein
MVADCSVPAATCVRNATDRVGEVVISRAT